LSIEQQLNEWNNEAVEGLNAARSLDDVNSIRIKYLGKKGYFTTTLRNIGNLSAEEKPVVGKLANKFARALEEEIKNKEKELKAKKGPAGYFDVSLPGTKPVIGRKHLVTQIIKEATEIFLGLGYKVGEGPEVEMDFYNFTALNTPPDHPARSLQDTFYLKDTNAKSRPDEPVLLRTHTSPVQIHLMEEVKPPLFYIMPGKAYRRDIADPSHTPMFNQIEGLAVDENITFGDLKGTLEVFVKQMFGEDRAIRMRPHYFPFTEPSAEVDVSCALCQGKAMPAGRGCRLCGGNGWLEILGCGMVDPAVLANVNIDSEKYVGFAFGMGVERIAVLKYGLDDIRMLYENDVRFLEKF
jgi:phenylalanyl-tRNA synthetase alpha chain